MNNQDFLKVIYDSFKKFIDIGTSRSTDKLKPLHSAIANDICTRLGSDYSVMSQGVGDGKESTVPGRYIDKKVDITFLKEDKPIAGIGVKFVMQNYSQNSNNYFENMLGETANLRVTNFPYFQVFIIFDTLPYYDNQKNIKRWEQFTDHNASKYLMLSNDNPDLYFHTPNKTLIYIVRLPENKALKTLDEYLTYYKTNHFKLHTSDLDINFGSSVILNDYETFSEKVYHTIKAL